MDYVQDERASEGFNTEYGSNTLVFQTQNTQETLNLVKKINATYKYTNFGGDGVVISEQTSNYGSTDFSPSDLELYLILRLNEDDVEK